MLTLSIPKLMTMFPLFRMVLGATVSFQKVFEPGAQADCSSETRNGRQPSCARSVNFQHAHRQFSPFPERASQDRAGAITSI